MKTSQYHYIPATLSTSGVIVELQSIADFRRYLDIYPQKVILVVKEVAAPGAEASTSAGWFAFSHHGTIIRCAALGFATLDDCSAAEKGAFPDAAAYYAGTAEGYANYADYELLINGGVANKDELTAVKSGGFLDGYEAYKRWIETGTPIAAIGPIGSAAELYRYATNHGFANFEDLRDGLLHGFATASVMSIARDRGFTSHADYEEAIRIGFSNSADLNLAREKGIRDRDDMERYMPLQYMYCSYLPHDARVCLSLLARLEQGKRISVNKLYTLLGNAINEYRYADTGEMPPWFTTSMPDVASLAAWLLSSDEARTYGQYDEDGEFYEVNPIQDRSVVIDGSNVAYNSVKGGKSDQKPALSNVLQLVQYLSDQQFKEITVIVDAALRHKVDDHHLRAEIEEYADYMDAPAGTPADLFIIQYVKAQNCLLISNDTFREWKQKDPWVAGNIDYYRLPFMIKGEQVLIPDLK